jgi:hypothetical protein
MTPEEINKTIDFLIQHAATFSTQMDELKLRQEEFAKRQEQDHKFILDLAKSTAQFPSLGYRSGEYRVAPPGRARPSP